MYSEHRRDCPRGPREDNSDGCSSGPGGGDFPIPGRGQEGDRYSEGRTDERNHHQINVRILFYESFHEQNLLSPYKNPRTDSLMEIKGFSQCIAANKQQRCGLVAAASCGIVASCEFFVCKLVLLLLVAATLGLLVAATLQL